MVDKMRVELAKLLQVEIRTGKAQSIIAFGFGVFVGSAVCYLLLFVHVLSLTELVGLLNGN
jgi:hypothetical protein